MPNVMAALPNIGGALRSAPQSLADAKYYTVGHKSVKNPVAYAKFLQTRRRKKPQDKNIMAPLLHRTAINNGVPAPCMSKV